MDYEEFRKQAQADFNQQPVNPEYELTTYNTLDYNNDDHRRDLLKAARKQELVMVCDEESGGIIAYAIGDENATLIAQALLFYRAHLDAKEAREASLDVPGTFYVDVPNGLQMLEEDNNFVNLSTFKTEREAIAFAQENVGADEYGRVLLVTGGPRETLEDEDEDEGAKNPEYQDTQEYGGSRDEQVHDGDFNPCA